MFWMKVVVLFVLNILAWVLNIHQPIIVNFFFVAIRYLSYRLLILLSYYYRIFPYFTWLYYLFTLFEVWKLILLRVNVFIIILIYKIVFIVLNYLSNISFSAFLNQTIIYFLLLFFESSVVRVNLLKYFLVL